MTDTPTNNQNNGLTDQNPPKPVRLKPKQKKTIELYFDPNSQTYGNLYKSALMAGFRPSYALNIANRKPLWLSETVESTLKLEQDHIIRGVQNIATKDNIDSRSPDDTRLKAFETLGTWAGLAQQQQTNVTIVQPILAGDSHKQLDNNNVIDVTPENKKPDTKE